MPFTNNQGAKCLHIAGLIESEQVFLFGHLLEIYKLLEGRK